MIFELLFSSKTFVANATLEFVPAVFAGLVKQQSVLSCKNRATNFALETEKGTLDFIFNLIDCDLLG